MSTSNLYSVLSDTVSLGKLDWNNYDHQEKVYYIPFDLAQLRRRLGTEAFFTTDLLRKIRDQKLAIQSELQKAPLSEVLTIQPQDPVWDLQGLG